MFELIEERTTWRIVFTSNQMLESERGIKHESKFPEENISAIQFQIRPCADFDGNIMKCL